MSREDERTLQLDRECSSTRYYRNAVERHWDPMEIDISKDTERLVSFIESDNYGEELLDQFRQNVARFGAGEQAVTEDLAPLATTLEDIDDQLFVTTQLYEEAKHTDFFDRYWREVIHAVEAELGLEYSSPTEDRWFNQSYEELFERNERAMHRLLDDPTPENFARAYSHYHLTIEGILAQTGYYGMQHTFSEEKYPDLPHLPGLYEGFTHIRQDEGRHVGFGMTKLKTLVLEDGVDPQLIDDTVMELMEFVNDIAANPDEITADRGMQPEELSRYASEKHVERMSQIRDADEDIPDVESLTRLDSGASESAQ